MNTEPITNLCPKCGGTIPGDAPQGLCPRCVLAGAARPTDNGLKPGERPLAPSLETVADAFPQLEILELIGQGGMGVVYKARQPKLDRLVALKLLPTALGADPAFAERFQREAKFLARLNHPNIVTVHDFGQSGGFCYLLLEYVDGVNLRQAMQAGRFSPAEALAIVPGICGALQYAHDQGVLHRDIKPENILLDARGAVKLADFGIAKLVREPGETRADVTLTQSGARLGTPHYMAPEQIERPSEVDHRADIYSLGVVFYELLTGELPLGRFAPPSEKADLDARVDAIVFRALAKERELRQQSACQVKTEVEGVTSTPRERRREGGPAPASRPPLKLSSGYITTPEKLATFTGQFFLYRNRGQLILDDRQLTCSLHGTTTVIPLAAIRDLSIGRYPRVMNIVGINFLSLTYEETGRTQRVFLSPSESAFGLPSSWNQRVDEWLHAIRDAAHTATGRTLATTPMDRLEVPRGSKGIYLLLLIALLIGVTMIALLMRSGPSTSLLSEKMAFIIGSTLGIGLALIMASKAARRSSDSPPSASKPNPWPHRLFWLVLALFLFPVAAVAAALVAPHLLGPGLRGAGSLLAGIIPMVTGALLMIGFLRTRPSSVQAQPRAAWNPWPKRIFYTVLLVVVMPALLLVAGLIVPWLAVSRQPQMVAPPTVKAPNVATEQTVQLIRTERTATGSQVRLRWELRSAVPASARVSYGGQNAVIQLSPLGGNNFVTDVTVQFERFKDRGDAVELRVIAEGVTSGTLPRATLSGDPAQLLAKANELVVGDLALPFNTPGWIAFAGLEQVRLEFLPRLAAAMPTTTSSVSPEVGGLPQTLPTNAPSAAALKWHFAWQHLEEKRKRVEVGAAAPIEVLAAERDLAVAEAEFRNTPWVGAEANVAYAKAMVEITRRMLEVGKATQAELNDTLLARAQAEEFAEKHRPPPTPTSTDATRR